MRSVVFSLAILLVGSVHAEQRYLVVDDGGADQDVVVQRRGWNWDASPPDDLPPDWQDGTTGDVGVTHRVEPAPLLNGKPDHKRPIEYRKWKIVSGAWVARDQADVDSVQLSVDQDARLSRLKLLQQERTAFQVLIDDPASPSGLITKATSRRDDLDAIIDTHQSEWGNLWTRGTNP